MNGHLKRVLILLLILTFVFQMAGITSLSRVQAYADTETAETIDVPEADEAEDMTAEEIDTESPGEIETDGENPPDAAEEPSDPETVPEETAEVPEETAAEEETSAPEETAEEAAEEPAPVKAPALKAAAKAEKLGTVLAFTSDTHNKSGNTAANRLGTWIEKVESIHGDIDVMAFGGDMAGAGASGYWDLTQADFDMLVEKDVPGAYTTGNHEISMGGDFSYNSYLSGSYSSTETKGQFEIDKEVASGDDYRIYALGSRSDSQSYPEEQRTALANYLNGVGNDKVIFIITHFPLHYYGSGYSRTTTYASEMIDLLNNAVTNNGQTIVFLWGHNHTLSDTYYDQIYGPNGVDSIKPTSGSSKTIKFYYGGAGCMSDTENGGGSEFVKGKGLVATINPNGGSSNLEFHYYNADGSDVTESNSIKSVNVEVTDPIPATGVTINEVTTGDDGQPVGKSIAAGKTLQLHLTLEPAGASSSGVTWSSSDESVATVSSSGLVTAKKEGTATITAAVPSGTRAAAPTSSIEITVTAAPKEVNITPESGSSSPEENATISVGETLTINVTNSSSRSDYDFTATLSKTGVAEVQGDSTITIAKGETGKFTVEGLTEGTVDITIQNNQSSSQYVRKGTIHLTVTGSGGGGDDPTPTDGTKYILVDKLTKDSKYLIVSTNIVGNAYAITNNGSSSDGTEMGSTSVQVASEDINGDGTADLYISSDAENLIWEATENGSGFDLGNNNGFLGGKSGNVRVYNPKAYGDRYWTYTNNALEYVGGSYTYEVYYDNGFTGRSYNSGGATHNIYIFEEYVAGTDPVSSIILTPETISIGKGASSTLTATVQPATAANKAVSWSTSDASIATVDNGKVTGVAEGTATITVTTEDGGFTASCEVTVTKQKTYVITIGDFALSTNPTDDQLVNSGSGSQRYYYTGLAGVEYQSGDTAGDNIRWIIEETTEGYYIKSQDGRYLNATYGTNDTGGSTGALKLDNTPDVWILDGTLEQWKVNGSKLKSTNADKSLTHEETSGSSTINLFTIRSTGETSNLEEASDPVAVTGVTVSPTEKAIAIGEEATLVAIVAPEDATNKNVTWSSSNTSVATVDENGKVKGIAAGTATITVTTADGGKTAECIVTVNAVPVTSVSLDKETAMVETGKTTQLTATVLPENATNKNVTWSSGDAVATVDQTGKVTGVAEGTATITVTTEDGGKTATCSVTVTAPVVRPGYVIVIGDYALSTEAETDYHPETSSGSTNKYYGLKGVEYDEANIPDNVLWTLTPVEGKENTYYIQSMDGKYLNATYKASSPYEGHLNLDDTQDEWVLDGSFEDWIVSGCYLSSTNATNARTDGRKMNLAFEETGSSNNIINIFTVRSDTNADESSLTSPDITAEVRYEETNVLADGKEYIIAVTKDDNHVYAIKNNSNSIESATLEYVPVSEDADYIITDDSGVAWKYTSSSKYLSNNSRYLQRSTSGLSTSGSSGYMAVYDASNQALTLQRSSTSTLYSVTCNNGTFGSSSSSAAAVRLFEKKSSVTYSIKWVGADGTVLKIDNLSKGQMPEYTGDTPTKAADDQYTYNFIGWSPEITAVTGLAVYTAQFEAVPKDTHEHTYGEPTYEWATDNSTCTATAVCSSCEEGTEGHTVTETVNATSEITTPATCEGAGVKTFTATFTNTLFSAQTKAEDITAKGHAYGIPEYVWSSDNSSVTATRVCANDASHVETETVAATSEVTTAATCTTDGVKTWTSAAFENEVFVIQTKQEDIAATGHAYGTPKYVWASDNSSVTATRMCANDASHVETETVDATSEVTTAATCTEAGVKTWTSAAFSNTAFAVQTTTENIPETNHDWDEPTYEWAADHTSVTATRICKNDPTHVETETATATGTVTTAATCTTDGVKTWTSAAFENEAFAVQTATETIPKIDHDWEFVNFTWTGNDTDGYTAAVANYKCKRNESHIETVDATVTPVTTVATCEDAGQTVYTAEVAAGDSLDGAAQNDSKTVAIEALGHKWSTTPIWTWIGNDTDGYTVAKATFTCENDATHKEEAEDTEIDVVTVDPTPTTAGSITYTASVTGPDNETYTDQKVKTLTPTGYTFNDPVYTWADDFSTCTALKECIEEPAQNITETVTPTSEVTTAATCETAGVRTYTATFTKTDFETQTKTAVIPATDHDWNDPTYEWATDHTSVTATRTCKNDASHVETETVNATGVETTAATCTTDGVKTWTSAAFENEAFAVQIATETITAINHDWNDPTYDWAADHTSVTATRVCKNDASHVETETAVATSEITTPATCTTDGVKTWTSAAFENEAFAVQTATENIPAINHDWAEPTYEWATDHTSVTATRICKNDPAHVETETATATGTVTTPATCTQEGVKAWTSAEFTNAAFEVQRTTETLPATGHDWNDPTYDWAADHTSVTATRTCKNDPAHVETDTASATGEVTKAATCTEDGVKTWTSAAFSNNAFAAQTTTEVIDATGHIWIEPAEWTWIGDEENGYTKVTGTFICQNDSTHTQTVESTNITVNKVEPTPTQAGKYTYSAKVTGPDNVVYSIQKEVIIPPAGYTYKDPVYDWTETADGYSVTALKECNEDHTQDITETVNASYAVTTAATCLVDGIGTYTATFTNSAFATQTKTVIIEAAGHKPVTDAAVAPTCTETGLTAGSHCSVCDEVLVAQETIPALGHDWKQPAGVWNDDHTSVVLTFVCNRDASHTETVTASGTAITSEITMEPTATAPGVRTYTATVTLDGKTYTVTDTEAIPATGSTVSGNITSYKGNTEEGLVTVQLFAGNSETAAYTATVTDNTSYAFEGVAAGTYTMKVSKKDHVTRSYEITVSGSAVTQDVKIHLIGDVSGDGRLTTGDVARTNSHVKEIQFLEGYEFECADIDGNGRLTTGDVAKINSHVKEVQFLW